MTSPWLRRGAGDRVLRFLRTSTVVHALLLPLTLWLVHERLTDLDGGVPRFSWPLYLGTIGVIALPAVLGAVHGNLQQRLLFERLPLVGGPSAPTAWDHLFSRTAPGWVRAQLKETGAWVGGVYLTPSRPGATPSLAAGHPHPRDLLLTHTLVLDEKGDYVLDEQGNAVVIDQSVLLRWDELTHLTFEPFGTEN